MQMSLFFKEFYPKTKNVSSYLKIGIQLRQPKRFVTKTRQVETTHNIIFINDVIVNKLHATVCQNLPCSSFENKQKNSMARPINSNPFLTEEDESHNEWSVHEEKRRQLQDQIAGSEDRQIESSRRALASLAESETMGLATAEV